jgi:uncharacterized membrane protein YhhN
MTRALAAIALLAAGLFAAGVIVDDHVLRLATKAGPVVALGVWVFQRAPRGRYRSGVLGGLAASLVGDMLLEIDRQRLFVPGLLAFLVAHVLYVVAYTSDARRPAPGIALPAYAYGAGMLALLAPGLGAMTIPVGVYTAVICTMLWRAGARLGAVEPASARLALAGAIVFAASDSMIALGRFGAHLFGPALGASLALRLAIMATYWLGQWGIAASAMRR